MKFGIYNEIQASPGANCKQRYVEVLRGVELGDALGYEVFMALEHHFFPTFFHFGESLGFLRRGRPAHPANPFSRGT